MYEKNYWNCMTLMTALHSHKSHIHFMRYIVAFTSIIIIISNLSILCSYLLLIVRYAVRTYENSALNLPKSLPNLYWLHILRSTIYTSLKCKLAIIKINSRTQYIQIIKIKMSVRFECVERACVRVLSLW